MALVISKRLQKTNSTCTGGRRKHRYILSFWNEPDTWLLATGLHQIKTL